MITSRHIVIDARIRPSSTGRYADRLLHHLQQIDKTNRYTVILDQNDKWEPTAKNFEVKRVKYPQFSFNPLDQIGFAWLLYRLKGDLVHFTMTQHPLLFFGNIVTTTHDTTMLKYTRKKDKPGWYHQFRVWGYALLFWQGHRKSKTIIVPTYAVKKQVVNIHHFTLPRIEVTYEAAEPPLKTTAKRPDGINPNTPFICYVGSPFPHKNGEEMINAFERLARVHPNLELFFIGKKEFFYDQLENYARKKTHIFHRIRFLGFISDEELKWVYQNAKVYVFPSLSEGFGLPGLEAMMHGLAVASSNIDVLKEVYGDAAYYFDPRDNKDMARAINEVMAKPQLRKELIRKGYAQTKKYSWERMAQQTKKIYEAALS